MAHTLPELPWPKDALAPVISPETIDYHHGKHHNAYVTKLNELLASNADLANKSLEDLVKTPNLPAGVFNNAAQVWNHTFYWHSMKPNGGGDPTGKVGEAIKKTFGDFQKFRDEFGKAAVGQFGSGWAWLVKDGDKVAIKTTSNADTPFARGEKCLLTCDVWEHAYYIDYRNARPKYVESWWKLVNWDFANKNFA